jgi:hypothetical protein
MKRVTWEYIKTSILGGDQQQRMTQNENAKTTFVGVAMFVHFLWLQCRGMYSPSKFSFCGCVFGFYVHFGVIAEFTAE